MDSKIKRAITEAMAKLVEFALSETKDKGIQVNFLDATYTHRIWVCADSHEELFKMISLPKVAEDIPDFECKIEKAIAEMTAKFETVDSVVATLNTGKHE